MPGPLAASPSPLFPPPKRWRADDDDVCAADRLMDGEKADAEATRRAAEQMESFIVGLFGMTGRERVRDGYNPSPRGSIRSNVDVVRM